ncbi:MAG: TonB-dependent receptor, partial [Holophagales bacterium]|nr:TonB-dependent receptor [Holophagales bacterium]
RVAVALPVIAAPILAQGSGRIEGKVTRDNGDGVGGVTVVVSELGLVEITDNDGTFRFSAPAGTYNLSFSLGNNADSTEIEVTGGQTTPVNRTVDWDVSFADTITVYSASRRRERIVDAPASVTLVTEDEIEQASATGQLAKVLEFSPGVEVTQSGVADFNLNTRGFNSSLNRRVQVLVDGRAPSVPILGSTEWSYLSNMSSMASVELVRGPSSALYGANAFNGVLNMVTKSPRNSTGGRFSIGGGELSTIRADVGWATGLGDTTYLQLTGMYQEGDSFYRSRVGQVEYPGLPMEVASTENEYDWANYGVRLDHYLRDEQDVLTVEGGLFEADSNGVTVTGIGRVSVLESDRTFLRLNYSSPRFNFLAYQNTRETPDQLALASGGRIFLDTDNWHVELQGNGDFNNGKVRLVGGISYRETSIDTANNAGQQTLVFAPVDSDAQAVFGQVDFEITDDVKLVLAGRYDESSLHDSQFSPKAAVVWGIAENHTLRFSYNEAFQVANYSEFFLDAPTAVATPGGPISALDLSGVEGLCGLLGVSCGFGAPVRVRALGNANLDLEEITAWEVGYSGIFGNKAFLTIDYYNNELENFITDLSANPFGSINPAFGPYTLPNGQAAPGQVIATLQNALGPLFAFLSNNVDGTPILALASYTNAGSVDTEGIDLGLNYYITPEWLLDFSYSWFDFEITELGAATQEELLPNAPESKFSVGLSYNASNWGVSLKYRWTDEFQWAAGAFQGFVEDYEVVDLDANYQVNERVALNLNVANLFDDEHYQSFGGDILGRRAIGSVSFNW